MIPYRFWKFWTFIAVFLYTLLENTTAAPCHDSLSNSSDCSSRSNEYKDLSRIISRLNASTHGSLITELLDEDTEVSVDPAQQIIFPDAYEAISKPKPIVRISTRPRCADGLSLCEDIDSYPYDQLKEVLQRTPLEKDFFGIDEAPVESIANRIGEIEEKFICRSIDTTVFPKVGMNKNNKWKYIINQGEKEGFIQGIRIEKCLKPNEPCYLIGDTPAGYTATCKQKYILRRLLSVTETGDPIADSFHIPSACCCSFKKDLSFLPNFGRHVTPTRKPSR